VAGAWDYIVQTVRSFSDLEAAASTAQRCAIRYGRHLRRPHESPNQENFDVLKGTRARTEQLAHPSFWKKRACLPKIFCVRELHYCGCQSEIWRVGMASFAVIVLQGFCGRACLAYPRAPTGQFSLSASPAKLTDAAPSRALNLIVTYRPTGHFGRAVSRAQAQSELLIHRAT